MHCKKILFNLLQNSLEKKLPIYPICGISSDRMNLDRSKTRIHPRLFTAFDLHMAKCDKF